LEAAVALNISKFIRQTIEPYENPTLDSTLSRYIPKKLGGAFAGRGEIRSFSC
jgi:hypothetical protein